MKLIENHFEQTLEARLQICGPRVDLFLGARNRLHIYNATLESTLHPLNHAPFKAQLNGQLLAVNNRPWMMFFHN